MSYILLYKMGQKTTVQIEKETLEKLKKEKITKRESYDEIINRLMKRKNK